MYILSIRIYVYTSHVYVDTYLPPKQNKPDIVFLYKHPEANRFKADLLGVKRSTHEMQGFVSSLSRSGFARVNKEIKIFPRG